MDGPLKPNDILEEASEILQETGIDNLVASVDGFLFTSGNRLLRLQEGQRPEPVMEFEAEIMSLAAAPDGGLAIGLDGGGVLLRAPDGTQHRLIEAAAANCPTAMAFSDARTLIVCNGSRNTGSQDWQRDLLELGRSGSLLRINVADGRCETIARKLAYPSGVSMMPDGSVIVSEAWRHRLLRLRPGRADPEPVLSDLPAYPGRINRGSGGGYWLCAFAVRSQLQEFILREHSYRKLMMAEVHADYWIAPALRSGLSFKEPLQAGGVIRLGIHKPWAPTRSYGLVMLLDSTFAPVASAHSRAGGRHHGATSVLESDSGDILIAAKGAGKLLRIEAATLSTVADRTKLGSAI